MVSDDGIARPRELSIRALVSGCLIGGVLAMANVYMSLKTGWTDSGNITAAILGFATMSLSSRAIAAGEINTVQSVATMASAVVFTSGIGAAIPALAMVGHVYSIWAVAVWAAGLGCIGIAFSFVRSRQLLAMDLRFPTSIAMQQLVETMRRTARSGLARARTLGFATVAAGAVTWFRDGRPALLPSAVAAPGTIGGVAAKALTLGIGVNPMLLGGGALLGLRNAASIVSGSVIAFALLSPWLVREGIAPGNDYAALLGWLLWPGSALMVSSTLTSLAFDLVALVRAAPRAGAPTTAIEPGYLVLGGLGCVLVLATARATFGVSVLATIVALAVSLPLTEAAMRAYGETDIAPVGSAGQLVQLASASSIARLPTQNLPLGNVATGVASHGTWSLLALKIGQRLNADRASQLRAQLLGTAIGLLTALPAYHLITKAYALGSREIPAPGVMPWRAVADAASRGARIMPAHAGAAAMIAVAVGVVLTLLARAPRLAPHLPSPTALGMGFLVPQFYSTTIFLGALLAAVLRRRAPAWAERSLEPVASGLIVGESVLGVVVAALIALRVM